MQPPVSDTFGDNAFCLHLLIEIGLNATKYINDPVSMQNISDCFYIRTINGNWIA